MYKTIIFFMLCFYLNISLGYCDELNTNLIGENDVYELVNEYETLKNGQEIPIQLKESISSQKSTCYTLSLFNNQVHSNYVIEFIDFRIDDIDIYIPEIDGSFKHYRTGDIYAFSSRPIQHKNMVFPLPSIWNKPYTIYFSVSKHSQNPFVIRSNIRSFSNFTAYSLEEYTLLSFFYGILFCMVLYNFIRYVFTKDINHLAYVFYVLALSFFSLSRIDGLGFEYLWPNTPSINQYAAQLSLMLFVILSVTFALTFLEIHKNNRTLFRWTIGWMISRCMLNMFVLSDNIQVDFKLPDLIFMSFIILINYKKYRIKKRSTQFFIFAYSLMLTGFILYTLQDYGLIRHSFITYYALNIGVFAETILLSMAISEKTRLLLIDKQVAQYEVIKQLKENTFLQEKLVEELKEKEHIKDKVNKELEIKVRERTKELEQKNELLIEQKVKIETLASQIDKQYYYLQKESADNKLNLLWTKHLSFEKFIEIFPDDISCLAYLEKLKWGNQEFHCVKCNHTNFIKNPSSLSRKCSRCTHIESVTANTLFHGIRFPLLKAFYITYCCVHGLDGITASSISNQLDLRLNTCTNFISKVKEQLSLSKEKTDTSDNLFLQNIQIPMKKL